MNDIRFAFRQLRKSPAFTIVAVLTLALGIGANTAIFSVIHAVLLRPLPYPEPERIMALHEAISAQEFSVAFPDYLDWRRDNTVFEHLAVSRADSRNLSGLPGRDTERISAAYVTANFFQVIGLPAQVGHTVFDPKFARQLGLETQSAPPTTGTGTGDVEKSITKPVRITLHGFTMDVPQPWVIDLSKAPLPPETMGLLGAEIFKSHVVRIDPVASRISVFDPASYRHDPKCASVPLLIDGDKLFIEAKLEAPAGKTVTHKLRIDTGSESSINDEVAQQSEEVRTSILGGGLGESFKSYSGVFTSAVIGPFTFKEFWGPGGPRPAIGMELLRRFVLTFDAQHGRLFLEPTPQLNEPVPTPPPAS